MALRPTGKAKTVDRLDGRSIIITGGGQGIGREYAISLAARGASITIAEIAADKGSSVADEIVRDGGAALFVETDVTDAASTEAMAKAAVSEFGRIDALVNNAAIYYGLELTPFDELDEAEWDKVMAVNVKGIWNCSKATVPHMRERGGGRIV